MVRASQPQKQLQKPPSRIAKAQRCYLRREAHASGPDADARRSRETTTLHCKRQAQVHARRSALPCPRSTDLGPPVGTILYSPACNVPSPVPHVLPSSCTCSLVRGSRRAETKQNQSIKCSPKENSRMDSVGPRHGHGAPSAICGCIIQESEPLTVR